ncbi:uncharacterized protein LOC117291272 [Asterias rubens]|uniref:uncharacterized protein LOC117291272 n=1 Tax=Asterias rubens TaxID=7604 RepID=UPI001455A082|nr:uncharacterized protein LOC117291272 [Asterias rubens]
MSKQNVPFFLAIFSLVIISWNCFINLYFTRQNIRCLRLANNIDNAYANLRDNIKLKTAAKYKLQQDIDDTKTSQLATQLASRAATLERFRQLYKENLNLEIQLKEELEKKAEGQVEYGKKLKQFVIQLLKDRGNLREEIASVKTKLQGIKDMTG